MSDIVFPEGFKLRTDSTVPYSRGIPGVLAIEFALQRIEVKDRACGELRVDQLPGAGGDVLGYN